MAYTYWINGNSAGPHLFRIGKLLLHTTEGSSIEGAVAAYRAANSWPHTTVDYMFGHPYRICRHLDYSLSGRALRNEAGGVQTNTAGVIQIEVVGAASRPHEIDWVTFAREVVGPLCRAHAIPVVSTLPWVPYPASYGKGAAQRLDGEAWIAYRGILGHQHAPENSHGDPGAIPIADVLRAADPSPAPSTPTGRSTKMLDLITHPDGRRVDLVWIGKDRAVWHKNAPSPADLPDAAEETLGGIAKAVSATWADGEFVVVVQGDDNELWSIRYVSDEVGWTSWVNEPPGEVLAPSANP